MPLETVRSKVKKASKKIETLLRKAREERSDCVLVVYGGQGNQEANIYYESAGAIPKQSR